MFHVARARDETWGERSDTVGSWSTSCQTRIEIDARGFGVEWAADTGRRNRTGGLEQESWGYILQVRIIVCIRLMVGIFSNKLHSAAPPILASAILFYDKSDLLLLHPPRAHAAFLSACFTTSELYFSGHLRSPSLTPTGPLSARPASISTFSSYSPSNLWDRLSSGFLGQQRPLHKRGANPNRKH
jgi:hypothetical protein